MDTNQKNINKNIKRTTAKPKTTIKKRSKNKMNLETQTEQINQPKKIKK